MPLSLLLGCSSVNERLVSACPEPNFPDEHVGRELQRIPFEGWPRLATLLDEIPAEKVHSPDSEDFLARLEFELLLLEPDRNFADFYDWLDRIEKQNLKLEVE